jgi:hypothetical protein
MADEAGVYFGDEVMVDAQLAALLSDMAQGVRIGQAAWAQ